MAAADMSEIVSQVEYGVGALGGETLVPGEAGGVGDSAEGGPGNQVEGV
jgi:hypothetical protein